MADKMSQDEIDKLFGRANNKDSALEEEAIEYHVLICVNCKKSIYSRELSCHSFFVREFCPNSKYGHSYISLDRLYYYNRKLEASIWRDEVKIPSISVMIKTPKIESIGQD